MSPVDIYPIPVTDVLTIEFKDDLNSAAKIDIQNILGQVILRWNEVSHSDKIQIDIQHFPAGLYWLNYTMKNGYTGVVGFSKL